MSEDNKVLKKKSKQSSMTVASMSIGVSIDALEKLAPLFFSYDNFLRDNSYGNLDSLKKNMDIIYYESSSSASARKAEELKNSQNSNGQSL